jgi:hypothetical protein
MKVFQSSKPKLCNVHLTDNSVGGRGLFNVFTCCGFELYVQFFLHLLTELSFGFCVVLPNFICRHFLASIE